MHAPLLLQGGELSVNLTTALDIKKAAPATADAALLVSNVVSVAVNGILGSFTDLTSRFADIACGLCHSIVLRDLCPILLRE